MIPRRTPSSGWIEVVTGCMFSGKTEELIRRLNRARFAKLSVAVFKPSVDVRYGANDVVTHRDDRVPCVPVGSATDIARRVGDTQVVGIDEAQFFDQALVDVANRLANEGRQVIVAGLDQDYRGVPFSPIPELMAVAEYVDKMLAVCTRCGAPANRSQRLVPRADQVLLGSQESYEARCRAHWDPNSFDERQERLPL